MNKIISKAQKIDNAKIISTGLDAMNAIIFMGSAIGSMSASMSGNIPVMLREISGLLLSGLCLPTLLEDSEEFIRNIKDPIDDIKLRFDKWVNTNHEHK